MKKNWTRALSLLLAVLLCVSTFGTVVSVNAAGDGGEEPAVQSGVSSDEGEGGASGQDEQDGQGDSDSASDDVDGNAADDSGADSDTEEDDKAAGTDVTDEQDTDTIELSEIAQALLEAIEVLPSLDEISAMEVGSDELNAVYEQVSALWDIYYDEMSEDEQKAVDVSDLEAISEYINSKTETLEGEETTVTEVATVEELKTALSDAESGDTIQLTADLDEVNDNGRNAEFFIISTGVTIDLNGHTITANLTWTANVLFKLETSEVVTIKNGKIDGSTTSKAAVVENYNFNTSYSSGNTLELENLTITGFGTAGSYNNSYSNQSLIYLNGASNLSINGCNISENGFRAFYFTNGTNESSVTVEHSTISENYTYGNDGGGFRVSNASTVVISDSTISGNYGTNTYLNGGGFAILSCDSVTITNNTIKNNKAMKKTSGSTKSYGGGFYLASNSNVSISSNTISNNASDRSGGGGYITSTNGDLIITNNTIDGNSSKGYGGGLYISNSASYEFRKVEITGNTISKNTVGWGYKESDDDNTVEYYSKGGGLCLYDNASSHSNTSAYDLSGNTITDNSTALNSGYSRGGGLSLYGKDAGKNFLIASGTIKGNKADWGGGIDYTYHCAATLILYNAIITENTAARGGGFWSCPSSTTTMYVTLGGTIYGNTGSSMAHSIRFEGSDSTFTSGEGGVFATVASRALGGTLMDWYSDEADDRYEEGDSTVDLDDYTNRETSFSLHGELSADGIALANAESTLLIADNSATQVGGGIASNAGVQFGEDEDVSLTVTKEWVTSSGEEADSELLPDSVTVQLIRVDSEENEVNLESVELSANNNWTYTFEELPGNYTYKVEEVRTSEEDYITLYSDVKENDDGDYEVTITNTIEVVETETVTISVTKVWSGDDDVASQRPDVTIVLVMNGEATGTKLTLNENNEWSGTFTELAKNDEDGNEIIYTIKEVGVSGYSTSISGDAANGFTVTNTYDSTTPPGGGEEPDPEPGDDTITYTVKKVWSGDDEDERPESVDVTLYRNGKASRTVTLDEDNNWRFTWTSLDSGNTWTVEENDVPDGYTATVSKSGTTFTITNTYEETEEPEEATGTVTPEDTTPTETPDEPETPVEEEPAEEPAEEPVVDEPEEETPEVTPTVTPTRQLDEVPQTGDETHLRFWVSMMILSALGLCALNLVSRKTRYQGRYTRK